MEIRHVAQEDLQNLAEVYAESFTLADPQKPWTSERAFKLLEHFYMHQRDLFFVACEGETLLGGMAVMIKPWREGNRCTEGVIFVDHTRQKTGVGKSLFIRVLEEAIAKYQADSFEAVTFAAKEFPLTWYEKIGLAHDEWAILIKGKTQDMLTKLKQ
jgi:GNAT superfamily N-acetyltransferase